MVVFVGTNPDIAIGRALGLGIDRTGLSPSGLIGLTVLLVAMGFAVSRL